MGCPFGLCACAYSLEGTERCSSVVKCPFAEKLQELMQKHPDWPWRRLEVRVLVAEGVNPKIIEYYLYDVAGAIKPIFLRAKKVTYYRQSGPAPPGVIYTDYEVEEWIE